MHGNRDMVAFLSYIYILIDKCGVSVDTPTPNLHLTPLHSAFWSLTDDANALSVVRFLVEKSADVTLQSSAGETAAELALRVGKLECYGFLRHHEALSAGRKKILEKKEATRRAKRAVVAIDET